VGKMTLKARVLRYVKRYPGTTAWGVAKALNEKSGTVSGVMYRMFREHELSRLRENPSDEREGWKYYLNENPF
jgi:hypothetical protein